VVIAEILITALIGYYMMDDESIGFDPTIVKKEPQYQIQQQTTVSLFRKLANGGTAGVGQVEFTIRLLLERLSVHCSDRPT
jgi:hypothetical protein